MNTGLGEDYEIPVPWYLITHPEGNVVIDGGNAAAVVADPVAYWGEVLTAAYWPTMTAEEAVVPELKTNSASAFAGGGLNTGWPGVIGSSRWASAGPTCRWIRACASSSASDLW